VKPYLPGSSDPVVVDTGMLESGERYEWVAFRNDLPAGAAQGVPDLGPMACLELTWPGEQIPDRMPGCEGPPDESGPEPNSINFGGFGVMRLNSQAKPPEDRDVVFWGTMRDAAYGLQMTWIDGRGRRHPLRVDFARVDGELLERAGRPEPYRPFAVFVARLPGEVAPDVDDLDLITPEVADLPPGYEPYPADAPERCKRPPDPGPLEFVVETAPGEPPRKLGSVEGRWAPPGC
jgi:hypothetical protein